MTPWLIFLFIGAMDWGFYAYALIATEAAARVGCLYTSASAATATDSTTACTYALYQLRGMPNVGTSMTTCATSLATLSQSSPVYVAATSVSGPDTSTASQVVVAYMTPILIPMMGRTAQAVTIQRTIQMRLRG